MPVKCAKPAAVVETKAWVPPARPARNSSVREHNARVVRFERAALKARVDQIGGSASCSGRLGSAAERVELLARRVRRRLNPDPG